MKTQFELDDEYERIFDLKKRVIEPAVKDINKNSNISVVHTYKKTGRNVTHILFEFKLKSKSKKVKKIDVSKSKSTPLPPKITVDNLDYFEDLRKKYGNQAPIPENIESELKRLGRWKE